MQSRQTKQIKAAIGYAGLTQAALASGLNTLPQNLSSRITRGTFKDEDLEEIAQVLGAKYVSYFEFPDGTRI